MGHQLKSGASDSTISNDANETNIEGQSRLDRQASSGILTTLFALTLLAGNGYFATGLETEAYSLTWIRSLIAFIVIGLLMTFLGRSLKLFQQRDYGICIIAGMLLGVHWVAFFHSMSIATVTLGMTMLFTYPLMTLVLQACLFGQRVSARDWILAPLVMLGVWLMGGQDAQADVDNLGGVLLGLFSALCFAVRNLIQQQYLGVYPPHTTIFYQTAAITVFLLAVSLGSDTFNVSLAQAGNEWHLWLLLGVFFTALPHSLLVNGIRMLGAKPVAMMGCMQPLIATGIAYVLLDEMASTEVIAGAILVLFAASMEIFNQMQAKQSVKETV